MRKPQMVAAILAIEALLLIGAACGSDEASSEAAGLSPLAPEQVVPAPQEPIAEPDDPSSGQVSLGLPPVVSGSPLAPVQRLVFNDLDYIADGSYGELLSGDGTVFVRSGIEIDVDDMEVVGSTSEGNTPGIQDGLIVYRLKDDGTNDVYTFNPGKDHVNPEDGQIFKGRDSWLRWTAQ